VIESVALLGSGVDGLVRCDGLRFGRSVTKIGFSVEPEALTVIGLFAE
jgi:hypothetical protein